jgi:WD40 repeat protein
VPATGKSLAVDASGDRVAIAVGKLVTLYELPGGRVVGTIHHAADVTALAFAARDHDLVSGDSSGSLLVSRDGVAPFELARLPAAVDVVEFLPDGHVVVADARPHLGVYDVAQRKRTLSQGLPEQISTLRASPDGRRVLGILGGVTQPPILWDLGTPGEHRHLSSGTATAVSGRFVDDGRAVLIAGGDGTATLWDAATGTVRQSYLGGDGFLTDAVLGPNGLMVLASDARGTLRFWDASSGHMVWSLPGHRLALSGIEFDGTSIATRSAAGEVARWEMSVLQEPDLTVRQIVHCLPLRYDDKTRALVPQDPRCSD